MVAAVDQPLPAERVLFSPREPAAPGPDVAHDLDRYREWVARRQDERLASRHPAPANGYSTIDVVLSLEEGGQAATALDGTLRALEGQVGVLFQLHVAVASPAGAANVGSDAAVPADLQRRLQEWSDRSGRRARTVMGPLDSDAAEAVRLTLEAARGTALVLLDPGDELVPDALAVLGAVLRGDHRTAGADLVYGDEDVLDGDGRLVDPRLKPDWSPELLLSGPYLGHPVLVRRSALEGAGGIRAVPGGDWEHDMLLRVTEHGRVAHVAEVLCHRRPVDRSGRGPAAVVTALERAAEPASVLPSRIAGSWSVIRELVEPISVAAVIPFRDGPEWLRACTDSVASSVGPDIALELVLVDNGSTDPETLTLMERLDRRPGIRLVADPSPFNWAALSNRGAQGAGADILLFLNNDIEAHRSGWLEALAAQALRPSVGAVGARLLYPGGRVQHAGMVVGLGGAAGHVLAGLGQDEPGYLGMAVRARECSAVTGACLATRREIFESLGGFDEGLGVDLNDVDYCLRLRQAGYRVLFEPQAELVHHESPSRGTSGSAPDIRRFLDRWEGLIAAGDPFLNAHLTRLDSSCALRRPDEEGWWRRWRSTLPTS